ncbi:hypothetical protein OH77DRAFT_1005913 [Trametes cingulata]|nr:hypothetical protein OH77DRAFT_1005913 [Trametes cingulata]
MSGTKERIRAQWPQFTHLAQAIHCPPIYSHNNLFLRRILAAYLPLRNVARGAHPSFERACTGGLDSLNVDAHERHPVERAMPPPSAVAAALQRVLDDLPGLPNTFFESSYDEASHRITDFAGGGPIIFAKSGLSKSNPINIGYNIKLGTVAPSSYTIWLYYPQSDQTIKRRAVIWGCKGLIEMPHTSLFMINVNAFDFVQA